MIVAFVPMRLPYLDAKGRTLGPGGVAPLRGLRHGLPTDVRCVGLTEQEKVPSLAPGRGVVTGDVGGEALGDLGRVEAELGEVVAVCPQPAMALAVDI